MRYLASSVMILCATAVSLFGAVLAVDAVEEEARGSIARALGVEAHGWARFWVDGLEVVMTGTAPDEAARFAAISAVGQVVEAARVVDRIRVAPPEDIVAPAFSLEILRNVDGISLIGLIPAETDRAALLDRLGRMAEAAVTDLTETGAYPVPPTWNAAVAFALDALETLPRAKASVTARRVALTAAADTEADKQRLESDLAGRVPAGVRLTLDISAPRPVIAPFTVRFVKTAGGPARFDACAADSEAARRAILAAAGRAGVAGQTACTIGIGAPSPDWARAVADGIGAVGRLGAGKLTVTDGELSLVVPHTVPPAQVAAETDALGAGLPDGYTLTAVQTPAPEADGDAAAEAARRPEFVATRAADGAVALRGPLPDARIEAAVTSLAHGHFGTSATEVATRVADGLPRGWALRALAALDVLAELEDGAVTMRADSFRVAGRTGDPEVPARIARLLAERLAEGADFEIDVAVDEALVPRDEAPSPARCVAQLGTVQAVRKITFEPGASRIDPDGLEIVDQIAEILRDCPAVPIEIGGHTDSQGREEMNLRLSQERADAVLGALMARRVLTGALVATGYGEAEPIADNATADGREANRRIEFVLIEEEPDAGSVGGPDVAPGSGAGGASDDAAGGASGGASGGAAGDAPVDGTAAAGTAESATEAPGE